jgi:TonB-dependent starch-binding outer membrane protein SusC
MYMKSIKTTRLPLLLLGGIITLLLGTVTAFAQTAKVSGTIINERTSTPASGATVTVKNTNRYAVSDEKGRFTIEASPNDVLIITIIGFQRKEVVVGNSTTIDVKLQETALQLEDVVVIGYGHTRRKDVTGSISSITGEELRRTQSATFDQALQGKVAGVMVQQVSGQPGGGVSIQIRGVSSISGTNSPLYVIDGVIIPPVNDAGRGSNPLNTINPAEIEAIDVLKDASATAIYGSQATNGVIIITTRRGKAGPPQITYDFFTGYQVIPKKLPVMDLQQMASFLNDRAKVWNFDARPEYVNPKYLGKGTDWQDELFGKAPETSHTLTVSGGEARTQYLLSTSYFDQKGIALGSNFRRYSVRLNLDNKTTSWLKIGTSLQLAHVKENVNATSSNVISTALNLTPDVPVQNPDGSWGGVTNTSGWINPVANPVALAKIIKNLKKRNQIFGNVYAEIQLFKDLSLRNEASGNFDFNSEDNFTPVYTFGRNVNGTNSSSSSINQNFYTVVRNFLTYNHNFGKYNINALAGHEAQWSSFHNVSARRTNFPSNSVQSVSAGDATTAANSGDNGSGSAQESYFGRINFSWNDKYLVTGNVRGDGSANFAPGKRWVATYSGALAWKMNNEPFLKSVKFVSELKLRIGYGLTNNQGIPGNTYVTQLQSMANGLTGTAQFQSNLANPDVTWEKTEYANAGLDGALLNWRISFSLDVYNRITDGLLLKVPLPIYSGTTAGYSPGSMQAPYANVGSIRNRGIDFRISSTNIINKNFTWKTDVTVSRNANKVLSLGSGGDVANLSKTSYVINQVVEKTVVGKPIGEFYGYLFDGVYANPEDFINMPVDQNGNPYPVSAAGGGIWYGDRKFKDLNGDGKLDTKDQTFLGSPIPKFQFGFNNTVSYKNFDLNIFFSGSIGNKVFNQLAISQTNPQNNSAYFTSTLNYANLALRDPNGSATDVNNVYVTNPDTHIVGLRNDNTNNNNRPSDLFIEDGSFLRCKNITLGYRLSQNVLSKIHLGSVRVYGTVSNAFLITNYSGMDPEIGSWDPLQAGWDSGFYPQSRMFTVGASIAFNK